MILHIDGDAFFASCEVSLHPEYKGKPLVVGGERGIITALTYEAKARGLSRGLPMHVAREICPEAFVVSGDYRSYGIFAERMYAIVRRYAPVVEEYSIDECFADITSLKLNAEQQHELLHKIQQDLFRELGLTFSLGLAPTKVLAKIASKTRKPFGLTIIPPEKEKIAEFLKDLPIGKVWGIGRKTAEKLILDRKVRTVNDFTDHSLVWVEERFSKPLQEIWHELHGTPIHRVHEGSRERQKSIMKTQTFGKPTADKHYLFSELSKNAERACMKARKCGLFAKEISFFLKTTEFRYHSAEAKLSFATASPEAVLDAVKKSFGEIYKSGHRYRSSGIVLRNLRKRDELQEDLFGETQKLDKREVVHKQIDRLARRFGKQSVFLASSMQALVRGTSLYKERETPSFLRLGILFWGEVV